MYTSNKLDRLLLLFSLLLRGHSFRAYRCSRVSFRPSHLLRRAIGQGLVGVGLVGGRVSVGDRSVMIRRASVVGWPCLMFTAVVVVWSVVGIDEKNAKNV